jgi:predicted Zn-dependent protease
MSRRKLKPVRRVAANSEPNTLGEASDISAKDGMGIDDMRKLREAAWKAQQHGDLEKAAELAAMLRKHFPDQPDGWIIGLNALRMSRQFSVAQELLVEAGARFPGVSWPFAEAAWLANARALWGEATEHASRLRERDPENQVGWMVGAHALRMLRRFEDAEALVRDAEGRFRDEAWPIEEAAWLAQATGAFSKAAALAEQLRRRFPDRMAGYMVAVQALRHTKRLSEAEAILDTAAPRFAEEAWLAEEAAWITRARGTLDVAAERAHQLRLRFPTRPAGYILGAQALRQSDLLPEAKRVVQAAIRQFPEEAWPVEEAARLAEADGASTKPDEGKL